MDPWAEDDRAERAVAALETLADAVPVLEHVAQELEVLNARAGYLLVFAFGLFGWAIWNVLMDKRQRLTGDRL